MADKGGIVQKQGRLSSYMNKVRQDEAKYHLSQLLDKYNVSLDTLTKDIASLNEVDKKAASKIKKMVDAVAALHKLDINNEEGVGELQRQLDLSGKRLEKWSGRLGKVRNFITEHVGEISAATLGIQGLRSASEALDSAVDTMVSTTGELGDNWDTATGHALKMSTQLTSAQIAAAGLVKDLDSVTEWQRKYYQLFRTGGDATYAIKGMAALTHSFGVDLSEMAELMESRQKNFNQTAKETTDELAGIHYEFRKVYESIDRTGSSAQKASRIWEKDFYSVVKEASSEISESGTDMHALSKILNAAYESANKLNVSYTKGKEIMSDVGKLFKLPETMKVEGASEILDEIKQARAKGPKAEDEVFKSYFKDVDTQLAKDIVSQIESGQLTSQMGADLLLEKMSKTGKGLAKTLSLQKRYLTELGDVNAQVAILRDKYQLKDPYLVRKLIMDGSFDKIVKEMETGKSVEDALGQIKNMTEEDRKNIAASLGKLQSDASMTWDKVTQSAMALIKNPVVSLVGSMGIFAGSAALRWWQNKKILSSLGIQKKAVDLLATGKGLPTTPDISGVDIPGSGKKPGFLAKLFGKGGGEAAATGGVEAAEAASATGKAVAGAKGVASGVEAAGAGLKGASTAAKGVGVLAKVGKGALKKLPIIGTLATVGLGAYEVGEAITKGNTREAAIKGAGVAGGAGGGWGGAALGAAIGTAIFPGVGTIIGGLLGGIGGALGGEALTEKIAEAIAGPEMGSKEEREEKYGLNARNIEALSQAMSSYEGPEEMASILAKRGSEDPRGEIAATSPRDTRLKFKPKGLLPNGTLTAEWTNPEAAVTLFGTYTRTMGT